MTPLMRKTILCAFALGLSFTATHADTFGSRGNAFTVDFVNIAIRAIQTTPEPEEALTQAPTVG